MAADPDNANHIALDIREILGNIIFWQKGSALSKWSLFFEIFNIPNEVEQAVVRENILKVIEDCTKVYSETLFFCK